MGDAWVTITEYVNLTGKSLSTVRRMIKDGRVDYRFKDNRYFVHLPTAHIQEKLQDLGKDAEILELKLKIAELEKDIQRKNDIIELLKLNNNHDHLTVM